MAQTEETPFEYKPDSGQAPVEPDEVSDQQTSEVTGSTEIEQQGVSWTASEYLEHSHGFGWYFSLLLAIAVLGGLAWLFTREITAVIIIAIVLIILGVFAARKPKVISYSVDNRGIQISAKFYPYAAFRSFGVSQEGVLRSIVLLPNKRYMPPISAYFEDKDVDSILGVLGTYLPFEQHEPDMVERLSRRIRF